MTGWKPDFSVSLARTPEDIEEAQRLRYRVFVEELGGNGPCVDHEARLECDEFEPFARHLLLRDRSRPAGQQIVGVYRLMSDADAARGRGFYCASEYDLDPLLASGQRLLELGRSCLHPDYRGGVGMLHLWRALSTLVDREGIDLLFGVASFHGTDVAALSQPLSLLHHAHLAPPALRVRSRMPVAMDILAPEAIDRAAAIRATPALIKAYLRMGGVVGEGAYVDHAFNTTDIFLLLETGNPLARERAAHFAEDRF